jgi:hypothetical protein
MRPSLRPRGGGLSRRREPVEAGDGAAEVPWREVGVPHGHLQVGVSEQLLNFPEPHTAHDRPGGEGVAKVWRSVWNVTSSSFAAWTAFS